MIITGELLVSTKVEKINDKFKKCNIVILTDRNTNYPQEIIVEVHNDNIEKLKGFKKGDQVTLDVNLRGRRYEKPDNPTRWFNSLVMWKIDKIGGMAQPKAETPPNMPKQTDDDNLPF